MWAQRLAAPSRLEMVETAMPRAEDLQPGQVLLKFRAAAICGSDMPHFLGRFDPTFPFSGELGFPLHEVVGEIVASKAKELQAGDRVVGIAERHNGLQEYIVNSASCLHPLGGSNLSDSEATVIQPLGTVFNALARLPDPKGKRVAVIGLGPIGVLFTYVLKSMGAETVIGVDAVDRSEVARAFGIDEVVTSVARAWSESLTESDRPEVVIEAVGHQQRTLSDAIGAVANLGHIFAFGVPDDDHYVIPFRELFRRNATLHTGATTDWQVSLAQSARYLHEHREFLATYITNVLPVSQAGEAFRMYTEPKRGRLKVTLTA